MSETAAKPEWKWKQFGKLKVLCVERTPDGDAYYLCRCNCGNHVRCSYAELKEGTTTVCPDCERGEAESAKPSSDTWSFTTAVNSTLILRFKAMEDKIPKWWWRCLNVIVDEMTQMLGREIYTDAQIAKYFGCPVACIDAVRYCYSKRIRSISREYKKVQQQFSHIRKIPSELISGHDVSALISAALSHRHSKARYVGRSNLYSD